VGVRPPGRECALLDPGRVALRPVEGSTFGAPGSVVTLPCGATRLPDLKKIEKWVDLVILVKF
jgi:hypothetical protein